MGRESHNLGLTAAVLLLSLILDAALFSHGMVEATSSSWRQNRDDLHRPHDFTLQTIETGDGDVIDCVDIYRQPAFNHPSLKNHALQKTPSTFPVSLQVEKTALFPEQPKAVENTGGCPEGTIPLLRTHISEASTALVHKGRRWNGPKNRTNADARYNGHEHSVVYSDSRKYYGAKASINVWNPTVEGPDEFSLAQIWLLSGSFDGGDLNSMEAGWIVHPILFGDNATRLFIFWTNNSYQGSGCYNLLCPGFVQISSEITLGARIEPVSTFDGAQDVIEILIFKDPNSGDWWFFYGDKAVGYWPSSLFTGLADSSSSIEWGGEIVNHREQGSHTGTQMGSGHFPNEGFKRASFFSNLQIVDESNVLRNPPSLSQVVEAPSCYGLEVGRDTGTNWGHYFFYGGPGRSTNCN